MLTTLVTDKSDALGTLTDASARLLDLSISYSFPVTDTTFLIIPVLLILDIIVKVWEEPLAKSPTVHKPLE